jgi:hypothetical protein
MLILLPKCPLCLAAMVSVLFGIGLSAETATVVHSTVTGLCVAAIILLASRQFFSQRSHKS